MDNINLQTAEALQNKRRGGRPRGRKLTDRLPTTVTAAQKQRIEQFCSDAGLSIKELVFKAISLYIPGFYSDHLASLSSNVDLDLGTIELHPQPLTEWGDREDHAEATIVMDSRGRDRLAVVGQGCDRGLRGVWRRIYFEFESKLGGLNMAFVEPEVIVEKTETTVSFWPQGIVVKDVRKPIDILNAAKEQWEKESNGVLTLIITEVKGKTNDAKLCVSAALSSGRESKELFQVLSTKQAYPYRIAGVGVVYAIRPLNSPKDFDETIQEIMQHSEIRSTIYNLLIKHQDSIASEEP